MEREDGMVMGQDVIFGDREVPVKDLEELSFDPAHITLAKNSSAQRPVNVSEGRIIGILGGYRSSQYETNKERVRGLRCTLAAKISAPRNTRSHAHCSVPMER